MVYEYFCNSFLDREYIIYPVVLYIHFGLIGKGYKVAGEG
jgi:hypothetical protein